VTDRLKQIENTAIRVSIVDAGKWELASGPPSVADAVLISVVDFNWMLVVMRDMYAPSESHEYGTENYRRYAALFNDISRAPRHIMFSDRQVLTDYLWSQGWRREVRPEDVTERA
jgi:hypothetical protein